MDSIIIFVALALLAVVIIAFALAVNFFFGYFMVNLVVWLFGLTMPTVLGLKLNIIACIITLIMGGGITASVSVNK